MKQEIITKLRILKIKKKKNKLQKMIISMKH